VVVVLAASSLTDCAQAVAQEFDEATDLVFAGSQTLRLQIEQGAPADVFLSADPFDVAALEAAGLVRARFIFAHAPLALIVPLHNPAHIESWQDIGRAQRLVIGSPAVPIGRYTRQLLADRPDLVAGAVSEEQSVRAIRAKVELGEADAAIVYRSDVSERVRAFPVPGTIRAEYVAALLDERGATFFQRLQAPPAKAAMRRCGLDP
jgi:molybdate transport system substrate-binding protein